MSRTKSSSIPHYEMLYIISNQYTEDELKPINEKVEKLIIDNGGTITYGEVWGKKRFCYPIKTFSFGYYFLVEFDVEGAKLAVIDKNLRMSSEVLRHQITSTIKRTAQEIKQEKEAIEKKMVDTKIAKNIEEEKKDEEVKKDSKKVDLKDLDERLDKILDTDDLL
jgi:small subunit ribosomal protein S6